jgi:hypothetical protein
MGINGQDWASYQSDAPSTTGLSFAFTKVTQGTGYVNPKWVAQRAHAKANGLVWGGYHYPDMGNTVASEADWFLKQVTFVPGDLVVLDWEGYDTANKAVPKAKQAAYKEAWLRYVKARLPHNPIGMYCNTDYWRNVDTTGYYGDFLWIATADLPAGKPGITAPWLFHQYSASTVDKDFCHLASTAALRTWALTFSEEDMPLTAADVKTIASTDNIFAAPPDAADIKTNPFWTLASHVQDQTARIRATQKTVAALVATVQTLAGQLGKDVDTAAVVAAVEAAIATAVIHVEVDSGPAK